MLSVVTKSRHSGTRSRAFWKVPSAYSRKPAESTQESVVGSYLGIRKTLCRFAWAQTISIGLSSQWKRGRKRHLCPAFSMTSWRSGFLLRKSFSSDRMHCMQQSFACTRSSSSISETPWELRSGKQSPQFCSAFPLQPLQQLRAQPGTACMSHKHQPTYFQIFSWVYQEGHVLAVLAPSPLAFLQVNSHSCQAHHNWRGRS